METKSIQEKRNLENEYIQSLSEKERKSLEIARNHLGSLFNIYKCNGFLQWKKKNIIE
jgi:hypothetical protein